MNFFLQNKNCIYNSIKSKDNFETEIYFHRGIFKVSIISNIMRAFNSVHSLKAFRNLEYAIKHNTATGNT